MNQILNYQGTNIYYMPFRQNKPYSIIMVNEELEEAYFYFNTKEDAQKFIETYGGGKH